MFVAQKVFLLCNIYFSSNEHPFLSNSGIPLLCFIQQSRTVCAILVEGVMLNNSVKLF